MKQEILNLIQNVELPNGRSKRFDCPSCGGTNSFSVTNRGGSLAYHCFKSSCNVAGVRQLDGQSTKTLLEGYNRVEKRKPFTVPDTFLPTESSDSCIRYLSKYPAAYLAFKRLGDITRFDVKENRLVYLVRDSKNNFVDAVGRSLNRAHTPKWKRYGSTSIPFSVGPSGASTCVLCEDAISASVVGLVGFTGAALMGTSLHAGFTTWMDVFDRAVVALDADASVKALSIAQQLNFYLPTKVLLLTRDLKMYTVQELKTLLEPYKE